MNAPATLTQVAAAATRAVDGGAELDRLLQADYSPRYLLEGDNLDKLERVAKRMASGRMSVPDYLKNNEADCFAIAWQAMLWNMDPFAVAQKTHIVNGKLGYEAQLINAVVQNSGAVRGLPHYEYRGEGQALECRAGFVPRGGGDVVWTEFLRSGDITTKNSPLWKVNPRQQMGYLQIKNWARAYCPGAILGVYTVDELQDAEPMAPAARRADPVTGEIAAPAGRPELPPYSAEAFEKNLPQWRGIVESGRKTADALLATLATKATFTDEQRAAVLALGAKPEAADTAAAPADDFVADMTAAEGTAQ